MAKLKAANPVWLLPTPVVQETPATAVAVRDERRPAPEEWLSFVGVSPESRRRFTIGRTANGKVYRSEVSEPEEQNEQNS